jgi:NAD(P)-dependent dehydrogenase (short-subunit alcohol dehydrogenase family)
MRIVITGGSSGLGLEIVRAMNKNTITDWSLKTGVDLNIPSQIKSAAQKIFDKVDALINCAGVNEIKWFPNLTIDDWDHLMNVNSRAIFLTTHALLENLRGGTVLNIVSNASHVPMTCSLAYNASKGAAAIMTKQMHRELIKTHNITVFSISPNKLKDTGMSRYIDERVLKTRGWTKEQARKYQLASLPAGEETDPKVLAEFIAFLLEKKERHKYLGGCDIPYGA